LADSVPSYATMICCISLLPLHMAVRRTLTQRQDHVSAIAPARAAPTATPNPRPNARGVLRSRARKRRSEAGRNVVVCRRLWSIVASRRVRRRGFPSQRSRVRGPSSALGNSRRGCEIACNSSGSGLAEAKAPRRADATVGISDTGSGRIRVASAPVNDDGRASTRPAPTILLPNSRLRVVGRTVAGQGLATSQPRGQHKQVCRRATGRQLPGVGGQGYLK